MAKTKSAGLAESTFQAILADITDGDSMRKATATHGVNRRVFFAAVNADAARANQYARAMEMGCEALADDIMAIADEARRGIKTTTKADGSQETVDGDMIERARLQVDARKWLLSKRLPKKYGDKLTQEITGKDGGPLGFIHLPAKGA